MLPWFVVYYYYYSPIPSACPAYTILLGLINNLRVYRNPPFNDPNLFRKPRALSDSSISVTIRVNSVSSIRSCGL
jgi:hypothetical protein